MSRSYGDQTIFDHLTAALAWRWKQRRQRRAWRKTRSL